MYFESKNKVDVKKIKKFFGMLKETEYKEDDSKPLIDRIVECKIVDYSEAFYKYVDRNFDKMFLTIFDIDNSKRYTLKDVESATGIENIIYFDVVFFNTGYMLDIATAKANFFQFKYYNNPIPKPPVNEYRDDFKALLKEEEIVEKILQIEGDNGLLKDEDLDNYLYQRQVKIDKILQDQANGLDNNRYL